MTKSQLCFVILSLLSSGVMADIPEDPFKAEQSTDTSVLQHQLSLKSYYQHNSINTDQAFNPGLTEFNDTERLAMFNWQTKAQWSANFQGRIKTAIYRKEDEKNDKNDALLQEAYLSWTSDSYAWQWQLGRIKTDWGNGFNWNLTNLLTPYKNRPYADLDDPEQQKGWDMLSLSYHTGNWHYNAVIADIESTPGKKQTIARLSYLDGSDYNVIFHKLPNQGIDVAASYSTLINDAITIRAQWSRLHQRDQQTELLNINLDTSTLQKFLFGGAYTTDSGLSVRLEYLKSQHGFDRQQWQAIEETSQQAYQDINSGQAQDADYTYLGHALTSLQNGQLRQNYLYFLVSSQLTQNLWQYRQSVQINLDDNSQLHRAEVLKSWSDHLTSRLQFELFNGCNTCEYGLNPNNNSTRLVLNWAF